MKVRICSDDHLSYLLTAAIWLAETGPGGRAEFRYNGILGEPKALSARSFWDTGQQLRTENEESARQQDPEWSGQKPFLAVSGTLRPGFEPNPLEIVRAARHYCRQLEHPRRPLDRSHPAIIVELITAALERVPGYLEMSKEGPADIGASMLIERMEEDEAPS